MPHDFAAQKAETRAAYEDLQAEHGLPDIADIDYFFLPDSAAADWRPLADALSREDFDCQYVEPEPDGDGEDDENAPYLVATLRDQIVSAEGIWIGEETATRIALAHGFRPDGWGMEG